MIEFISGVLKCGNFICPNPPENCRITTTSDYSKAKLETVITCNSKNERLTIFLSSMKSPKPDRNITITTEGDIYGTSNKSSVEN